MKTTLIIASVCLAHLGFGQNLTLRDAVGTAFAHRPAVTAARLKVESAKSQARAMGAFPATRLGVGQSTRPDLGATDDDFFISQSLDIFGRSRSRRSVGEAAVRMAEVGLRQVQLSVQSETASRYFEAVAAKRTSHSAESLLELTQSLAQATQRRFEEGKVPEIQVTRANLELARAKQTALLRSSQAHAALTRLIAVIGHTPETLVLDLQASLNQEVPGDLDRRPDIQLLAAILKKTQAKSGLERKSMLPELEVVGLRSPWRSKPVEFGARLQLTWSFYDFGKQKNEVKALRQEAKAIEAEIQDLKETAQSEVDAIQIEIEASRERVDSFQNLLQVNRTLVQKIQLGFEQGVGTLIDVLEATRSLRELEQEITQAELALNLATVSLYAVTGTLMEARS